MQDDTRHHTAHRRSGSIDRPRAGTSGPRHLYTRIRRLWLLCGSTDLAGQHYTLLSEWQRRLCTRMFRTRPLPFCTSSYDRMCLADDQDNCSVKRPQDANAPLFYYWQGSSQTCWCGNFYQRPQQQSSSNNPCYTGSGDTRALWAYGRISTTFTTYGAQCRTRAQTSGLADSAFTSGTQIGPVSCMRNCRTYRFAYYWSDVSPFPTCLSCQSVAETDGTEFEQQHLSLRLLQYCRRIPDYHCHVRTGQRLCQYPLGSLS